MDRPYVSAKATNASSRMAFLMETLALFKFFCSNWTQYTSYTLLYCTVYTYTYNWELIETVSYYRTAGQQNKLKDFFVAKNVLVFLLIKKK